MSDSTTENPDQGADELLAAYLDNELSDTDRALIETRLSNDAEFRRRLDELDKAWDMLGTLPKSDLDDEDFIRTTVEMITVAASQEIELHEQQKQKSVLYRNLAIAAGMLILVASGYWIAINRMTRNDRTLVENLPVIENLDEYQRIESVEFLEMLKREGLFAGDSNDGA